MAFGCRYKLVYKAYVYIYIFSSDGKFGLWLDSELNRGQSNTVSTFQNDVLSREVDFQIIGLELWAVAE